MIANLENLSVLTTGVRTAFRDALLTSKAKVDWTKVASDLPSSTETETYPWQSLFPQMREFVGDRQLKSMTEHSYSLKNKEWESSIEMRLQKIKDDQYNMLTPSAASAGDAAARFIDRRLFEDVLGTAFTTGLADDGVSFFSAAHKSKGTQSNYVQLQGGDEPVEPWFLLDCSRPIRPFFWQNRQEPEVEFIGQPQSEPRFRRRSVAWTVEMVGEVGFGLWQLAVGCKGPLVDDDGQPTEYFDLAYQMMMSQTDVDRGAKLGLKPTVLLVGASNRAAANKNILADRLANGADNTNYKVVDVIVTPYLP
jgi:phage major head subunit gpT-like protein